MTRPLITWNRFGGYECSTKGDARFSALNAQMPDGRTIEHWYQCDIKAYDIGGHNWKIGKGKDPLPPYPGEELYLSYKTLWRIWALHHGDLMHELRTKAEGHGHMLSDRFATSPINQARALSEILNEWL